MANEQPVQLRFLDEAEDCYEKIEQVLLGLTTQAAGASQVDEALRAAHSVKGGAAMMRLPEMSRVAHRLEDFFKILRVHHVSETIDPEVNALLLQGLDGLRQVGDRYRQQDTIDEDWLTQNIHPIFEQLQQHLGELTDADEDALLSQDETDADPALLMFEDGVEAVLDRIEASFGQLSTPELMTELATTADELVAFGHMANLTPFIELCQTIKDLSLQVAPEQLVDLSQECMKTWRRSHALVMRRRFELLPNQLEGFTLQSADSVEGDAFADALEMVDLAALQADFGELELPEDVAAPIPDESPAIDFADISLDDPALAELTDAFALEAPDAFADLEELPLEQPEEQAENPEPEEAEEAIEPVVLAPDTELEAIAQSLSIASAAEAMQKATGNAQAPISATSQTGRTVRVPVEQLEKFNTLFGQLVLERNTINLRLEQLQTFTSLMQERIRHLDQSNLQLQQWYDRASLEGLVPTDDKGSSPQPQAPSTTHGQFDALEMDRYTDLHLIAQDQIETIVKLQEVGTDIDITLQDVGQAVHDLNQTTRSLQGNITRTQMVSFGEVVKRFPRVIHDLSVQYNKPVRLVLEGENTLIDRAVLESLTDPLNHLLRNAFDHGIGDSEQRQSQGKSAEGTITVTARNRGAQTVIMIRDDGNGIQLDKIRDRLQTMGLTEAEVGQMSDHDLLNCIFEPGFSTASTVTELSGRGVGMDVVRTNLHDIRGDIQVDTEANVGTTFTITVPYSLSILRVVILEHAGLVFAVPVDSMRELLRVTSEQMAQIEAAQQIMWLSKSIPVVNLAQHWQFNQTRKSMEMLGNPVVNQPTVLVVGEDNNIGGIQIDRFWGEQEVTIRTIASPLPLPPGFVSSTVLGDGRVVPIVDPVPMLQWCLERGQQTIEPAQNAAPISENNTILVVDDSVNVRRFMVSLLEKGGYQVEEAKDGQEAVDKLNGGLSVQAVICDVEMPRLDGYGVLEEIKGQTRFADLPILMLTSRSHAKHRKIAMNLGASAYFSKPFSEQELLETLASYVKTAPFASAVAQR